MLDLTIKELTILYEALMDRSDVILKLQSQVIKELNTPMNEEGRKNVENAILEYSRELANVWQLQDIIDKEIKSKEIGENNGI